MKKFLIFLLALIMALCFAAGCGSGKTSPEEPPPSGPGGGSGGTGGSGGSGGTGGTGGFGGGGGSTTDDAFVVSLKADGSAYNPSIDMSARWTSVSGSDTHTAQFKNGKASITGLDGEYNVTLTALPLGYSYNPNIYTVDNENKSVTVDLVSCLNVGVAGGEPSLQNTMTLSVNKTYRATFKSAEDKVWFLMPACGLETLCDIYADNVLPKLSGYNANQASGYINYSSEKAVEGGGKSGTYTKNIKFTVEDDYANLNYFVMQAETNDGAFPVTVDFKLTEMDTSGSGGGGDEEVTPGPTVQDMSLLKIIQPDGEFKYNYRDSTPGKLLCDGSRFRLFARDIQDASGMFGDGYYHLYDEENDIYGAILFAKISQPCQILNKPLTDPMINVHDGTFNYTRLIKTYGEYCNADGAHPVTEELKKVLQGFAVNQRYFKDGEGWAELNDKGIRLQAAEEDQWLFCCGYYV